MRNTRKSFNWNQVDAYRLSERSRSNNAQKVWMRSTIPWKLVCDRDLISREQAAEIFSMRLDTLGFIDYVIALAVIVVLLVILPFLFFCCNCTGTNAYLFSEWEPFITRLLFLACFIGML